MLQGLIESCQDFVQVRDCSGWTIRQFKVIREFSTHGRIEVRTLAETRGLRHMREAVARLDLETPEEVLTALLFDRPDCPVTGRLEAYDARGYVESVAARGDGGEARLWNIHDMIEMIRGVVEANLQLHLADPSIALRLIKVRWVYLKRFPLLSGNEVPASARVRFEPVIITELPATLLTEKVFRVEELPGLSAAMGFYIRI